MHIGPAIKKIREKKGINQKELAAKLKTSRSEEYDAGNLSKIEKGKQGYSVEFLDQLPKALGVPLSDIFAEAEGKKDRNEQEDTHDPVHIPSESYNRLAKLVALWAFLADDIQTDLVGKVEKIVQAAQHGLLPPVVHLRSEIEPKRRRTKKKTQE